MPDPFLVKNCGPYALPWTHLSGHRFVANQVRLTLFVLAYTVGNFLRRLALPESIGQWSLHSIQVKLIKTGATTIVVAVIVADDVIGAVGVQTIMRAVVQIVSCYHMVTRRRRARTADRQ